MRPFAFIAVLFSLGTCAHALYDQPFISFKGTPSALKLSRPEIIISSDELSGVRIAANSLAQDIKAVTGFLPEVHSYDTKVSLNKKSDSVIIVGTIGSSLIQELAGASKLNVSSVEGRWETFMTSVVNAPLFGIDRALVITGNDKRGAIYGIYTLSEQIGVSPYVIFAHLSSLLLIVAFKVVLVGRR
jgi:hypothetical protein